MVMVKKNVTDGKKTYGMILAMVLYNLFSEYGVGDAMGIEVDVLVNVVLGGLAWLFNRLGRKKLALTVSSDIIGTINTSKKAK